MSQILYAFLLEDGLATYYIIYKYRLFWKLFRTYYILVWGLFSRMHVIFLYFILYIAWLHESYIFLTLLSYVLFIFILLLYIKQVYILITFYFYYYFSAKISIFAIIISLIYTGIYFYILYIVWHMGQFLLFLKCVHQERKKSLSWGCDYRQA